MLRSGVNAASGIWLATCNRPEVDYMTRVLRFEI